VRTNGPIKTPDHRLLSLGRLPLNLPAACVIRCERRADILTAFLHLVAGPRELAHVE
jgi:hypothetical protein